MNMDSFESKSLEPAMFLQRPSLGRSQDVSHILASIFRDFTRDSVGEQTVKNLTISRSGEEGYHEEYVERLAKIQSERQRQLDELAMLETHIMQARAAATAAEEQELRKASEACKNYEALGLPPVKSHLRYCMDTALLKRHSLITPEDYVSTQHQATEPPRGSPVPSYARPTTSSMLHFSREHVVDDYVEISAETLTYPFSAESLHSTEKRSSQISQLKSAKSKVSLSWRDSIKPGQRHRERTELQRLNAKAEYRRNPRHVPPSYPTLTKTAKNNSRTTSAKEEPDVSVSPVKPTDILVPSPSPVVFKEYKVGEVYEIKLELKNISSSLRQIRIIPPATKFFSIGLGQYPGERGMIAPGMSCQFAVKFAPDSLTDYEDKIQIRTQLDDTLDVLLLGKRKPPELTLSTVLDSGYCLIGGSKTVTFSCLNTGGSGRFCIVEQSEWPTTSCNWTLDNPGYVELKPFCLQPAMFQLLEGQEISLQLTFQPMTAKFYKHHVFMVCDNCQVKQFTIQGVGQTACVEFVSVDGGLSQPVIGESYDTSANHLVRFDDQNPCTTRKKSFVVKNMSNVALPFSWQIMKPCLRSWSPESERDTNRLPKPSADEHSVFRIEPGVGVLEPCSSFNFSIECSPSQVGNFHSVAQLVLEKVPVLSSAKNLGQLDQNLISMKTELKVSSKPFQVLVYPPVITIPGKLLLGKLYKYTFKMKNNSMSQARYDWQLDNDNVISIEPGAGCLGENQEQALDITVQGRVAGFFASTINCLFHHSTDPVYVHVKAEFQGPRVQVDNADVDFGLVRLGDSSCQKIVLTNLCEVPATWSLQEDSYYHLLNVDEDCKEMPSEFQFNPPFGELLPSQRITVDTVFTPLTCRRVRSVFECMVAHAPPSHILVTAEVQKPEICIMSPVAVLEEVYVNVPLVKEIEIENMTLLQTKFHWVKCLGEDSQNCKVLFQPSEGILGPGERKTITVLFTGSKEGPLQDLVAVCDAEGMDESVYLTFRGTIRGLEVSYRTEITQGDEICTCFTGDKDIRTLDFGKAGIGDTPRALLILTNHTAIKTSYNIEVEYLQPARTPTPPAGGPPQGKIRGLAILARSPNIANPLSKTAAKAHADFCRALLRDGRGAAFVCTPSCGELLPFQEHVIEITAYSDMWGEFKDRLVCKIDGLDPKYIPFTLKVEGCPLNFQMTKDKSPIVRFGSHVSGSSSVERVLRVNNTSPCDIRVDWEVYNEEADDIQLIDLIIDIGDPFPRIVNRKEVERTFKPGEDTPLITVDVRPHIGRLSNSPFRVNPSQQIIPARRHSDVRVTFNPFSSEMTDLSCSSFALGFINLDNSGDVSSDHVRRWCGRNKDPFRFNMTGAIKPAVLAIDDRDEEATHFQTCASDLIKLTGVDSFETLNEVYKTSHYTLCNTSQASVTFGLDVEKPFTILDISAPPSACQDNHKAAKGRKITLKPRKNVQVGIAFCLTSDMLAPEESEIHDIVQPSESGILPTLEIQKNLQILFSNKTSQTLPLRATVSLPHLLLSKESLDFGVCIIGQQNEMSVKLTNFGKSGSYWFVEKDSRYPKESRQVFNILPASGFLGGHVSHVCNNSVLLKLSFTARHNISYECLLVVKGLLNEQPRYLLLTARGSYDGGHEQLVSTATL